MGLDQYLERRTYVARPDSGYGATVTVSGQGIDPAKVKGVTEEVAYWRKANQIHAWFVDNVQGGADDCGEYYVSKDQLRVLVDTCKMVIQMSPLVPGKVYAGTVYDAQHPNGEARYGDGKVVADTRVAEQMLPTTEGFFFGGTGYDEWYIKDLEYTVEALEPYLEADDGDSWADFYYSSSW